MFKTIKTSIASLFAAVMLMAVPVAAPVAVYAQTTDTGDCVSQGSGLNGNFDPATGCTPADTQAQNSSADLTNTFRFIVNVFSVIVGVIAVVMIIYGGLRYITSGGDSGKITSAKNTIIYAIIGLIIVALAQFIVQFVLGKATGVVGQ
jgi:hypothetical protein